MFTELLGVLVTLVVWLVVGTLLGRYAAAALQARTERGFDHWSDGAFGWLEKGLARASGLDVAAPMNWKQYSAALLASNAVMWLLVYFILSFMHHLTLNPDGNSGMTPSLAFNSASSFISNT